MKRMWTAMVSLCLVGELLCAPALAANRQAKQGQQPKVEVQAKSAILVERETGAVLWKQAEHKILEPASVTKVMTMLLTAEAIDRGQIAMDDLVTCSAHAASMGGSQVYLKEGEQMTVHDLLKAVAVASGNDAAAALAYAACGSTAAFVEAMNERAAALGLADTHFANPHGLDDPENYSTARDLAVLAAAALKHPLFAQIVSTKSACMEGFSFVNHNKLLWQLEGAVGVKTGYTKAAGRILVSAVRRLGRTLICVTISDPDDWKDHAALYDKAFSRYQALDVAKEGEPVYCVPTVCGPAGWTELLAGEDLSLGLLPEERVSYAWTGASVLFPPYAAGGDAGAVRVFADNVPIAEIPVVLSESSS